MGNILNYLQERGNTPFSKSRFNKVDNVIMSQIVYLDFDGIVGDGLDRPVTIEKAWQAFSEKYNEEKVAKPKYMNEDTPLVLKEMASGQRFKNAKLSGYVNQIDKLEGKQFAALRIELDDGTVYIAFRGTDDYIVSWQEDFCMSYKTVPAQRQAASYLYEQMRDSNEDFRVGGHSKGGNLAVFAAMKCPTDMQEQIINVYDNDGPGFDNEVLESEEYGAIKNKVIRITPQFSIVGTLFEHDANHKIVGSSAHAMLQHDSMTWEVTGSEFVYKQKHSKRSRLLTKTLSKWINGLKVEERKEFVKSLFGTLREGGVEKLSEVPEGKRRRFFKLCDMALHTSKTTKTALMTLLLTFVTIYGKEGLNIISTFIGRK